MDFGLIKRIRFGTRAVQLRAEAFNLFNHANLFANTNHILGIPLLYAYVFAVWALLIGLMALVVERRKD